MTNHFLTADELRKRRRVFLRGVVWTGLSLGFAGLTGAQDGPTPASTAAGWVRSRPSGRCRTKPTATRRRPSTNWYEVPLPPPKEVRVHDIITIRVDLAARMSSDVQFQRRRTAQYNAILNDWVHLEGLRAVKKDPQTDGDQQVQGNLNHLDRVTGELETTEVAQVRNRRRSHVDLAQRQPGARSPSHDPQQRGALDALALGRLPPRRHRPRQLVLSKDICTSSREARNRPDARQLQTRLVLAVVRYGA